MVLKRGKLHHSSSHSDIRTSNQLNSEEYTFIQFGIKKKRMTKYNVIVLKEGNPTVGYPSSSKTEKESERSGLAGWLIRLMGGGNYTYLMI
jgi:hypothetical protein